MKAKLGVLLDGESETEPKLEHRADYVKRTSILYGSRAVIKRL